MSSSHELLLPYIVSCPTKLLTLQDIVLDTPVWRANVIHVEDQIDTFEKWLDGFVRTLRSYLDALSKVNTQASSLCKQLVFSNMDDALINVHVAEPVSSAFTNVLQADLQAKMKLVDDLDDTVLQPLQTLLKTDIKDFKDARRQFDRTIDKYENHLARYSILSKQKEPSALREDAFQLFDIQKAAIRSCRAFYLQLTTFKSTVEQTLIRCFTNAVMDHLDILDQSMQTSNALRSKIPGWRQWLEESKSVCAKQLMRMEIASKALEDVQIHGIRPHRSLKRYSTANNDQMMAVSTTSTDSLLGDQPTSTPSDSGAMAKQGYLFYRLATSKSVRYSWVRRWFFLQDGWFGNYFVGTVNRVKGCVILGDRVLVRNCQCRIYTDIDRRYCFEVTTSNGGSMLVQAETETEMHQWLWAIERAKEDATDSLVSPQFEVSGSCVELTVQPYVLLSPSAHCATQVLEVEDKPGALLSLSTGLPMFPGTSSADKVNPAALEYMNVDRTTMAALTGVLLSHAQTKSENSPLPSNPPQPSHDSPQPPASPSVSMSAPPPDDVPLPTKKPSPRGSVLSLTSASEKSTHVSETPPSMPEQRRTNTSSSSSSWSMPWLISALSASTNDKLPHQGWIIKAASATEPDYHLVWPNKLEQQVADVPLSHYPQDLQDKNKELRRYFGHVPKDEIVLQVFPASLYRQASDATGENADVFVSKLDSRAAQRGNGYDGMIYLTQRNLWFYSCRWLNCVNAVIIPLECIKALRLEKVLSAKAQGMLMTLDVKSSDPNAFCFGIWLESAEVVGERIRLAIENAKSPGDQDTQALYDAIRHVHLGKVRATPPTSHLTTFSTSTPLVTPLTVQVQQRGSMENASSSEHASDDNASSSSAYESTKLYGSSPATDALSAAMESVRENALKARKQQQQQQQQLRSSRSSDTNNDASSQSSDTPAKEHEHQTTSIKLKQPQQQPVQCECEDHLDKTEAELDLAMSAQDLFPALFDDAKTDFWTTLNKNKGNSEPTFTKWAANEEGIRQRTLTYTMPVTNPMVKAKEADVIETQKILLEETGRRYVITTETKTPTLPYADAFIPMIKMCITQTSPTSCRFMCNTGVKWLKSIMVKGMVNKAAMRGMAETVTTLVPIVQQQARGGAREAAAANESGKIEKQGTRHRKEHSEVKRRPHHRRPQGDTADQNGLTWGALCTTSFSLTSISSWIAVALVLLVFSTMLMLSGKFNRADRLRHHPQQVAWRAVHLTDLEPVVNGKPMAQTNSTIYQVFKESRSDIIGWKYQWMHVRHRLMAAELVYTREQLAALRYELLTSFRMLNTMDQRVLESEYWNWLLDQRIRCRREDDLDQNKSLDEPPLGKQLCQDVDAELDRIL
ncbi:hypothetical protein BC940DRAFT_298190 [Gongronella butleri]|nr:hypothetical protein BC940DRAFT_298190 [Gongronella butleri]